MVCTAFIDSVKHNGKEWLLHAWQSRQELHCSSILHQNANHAIGAAIKSGTLHVDICGLCLFWHRYVTLNNASNKAI